MKDLNGKRGSRRTKLVLLCGLTSVMGLSSLFAQSTNNLANLVNTGGTLTVDDKIFSNFGFQQSGSGLTSFDPSQITVAASVSGGIEYLTWSGNIAFAAATTGSAGTDLILRYVVTASQGSINMIDQAYTGSAQNGFIAVDETAALGTFGGTVIGYSHLDAFDPSDPPANANDILNITPPQTALYVTKDISFAVLAPGGFVTLSQVAQSFHQVPEPSTLALTGMGGLGVLLLRRRK